MLDVPRLIHWAIATNDQSLQGFERELISLWRAGEPSVARDKKQSSAKPGSPASGALEAATATHRRETGRGLFARDETTATAL